MRVGFIAARSRYQILFDFNTRTLKPMIRKINRLRWKRGALKLGGAIRAAKTKFFAASRKEATNVLLVFLAGNSRNDVRAPALAIQKMGVTVITVGIAPGFDRADLTAMTSPGGNTVSANARILIATLATVIAKIAAGKVEGILWVVCVCGVGGVCGVCGVCVPVNSKEAGTIPASRILKPLWRLTIELVDIECVLGDVSGVQILPL